MAIDPAHTSTPAVLALPAMPRDVHSSPSTTDRLSFTDATTGCEDLWNSKAANKIDQIAVGDGRRLHQAAADQLVSAMARFTDASGLDNASVSSGGVPSTVQLAMNTAWQQP